MDKGWRSLRRLAGGLALMALMLQPGIVSADDGEILSDGSNIASNVYISSSSGKARVNFSNLNDCPAYLSGCKVQVRFLTKCKEFWCTGFDDRSGWMYVPYGQDFYEYCFGNDSMQWRVESRLTWTAQTTKKVGFFGEYETVLGASGELISEMIAKFMWNYTNSTGYRHGSYLESATGTSDYSDPGIIASSGSTQLRTNC